MKQFAIDSHIHCGVQTVKQPITRIVPLLMKANIFHCCVFAPVEDIYPRHDKSFIDSEEWIKTRKKANQYLEDVSKKQYTVKGAKKQVKVFPYTFVWNDFDTTFDDKIIKGVKWHRHSIEPLYQYDSPECEKFLQKIYELKLPIVYEEEFENTLMFIKRLSGRTPLIIPHLGMLNGGYEQLKKAGVWENKAVWSDTALASKFDCEDYVKTVGSDRLLFGSDWPFGDIYYEKKKIVDLKIKKKDRKNILYKNIQKLLKMKIKKF